jgi:hypothetical protein
VTDSDMVTSSEGESATAPSDPEVTPVLGSATQSSSPWVLPAVAASVLSVVAGLVAARVRELTTTGRHPRLTPVGRTVATVDSVPGDVAQTSPFGPHDETDSTPSDSSVAPQT